MPVLPSPLSRGEGRSHPECRSALKPQLPFSLSEVEGQGIRSDAGPRPLPSLRSNDEKVQAGYPATISPTGATSTLTSIFCAPEPSTTPSTGAISA